MITGKHYSMKTSALLWLLADLLLVAFVALRTSAAPQELVGQTGFEADNETNAHDGQHHHHRPAFTATAYSGDNGVQNNYYTGGGGNQSAENIRDVLPEIQCYRCMPHRDNDYCNKNYVGEKVDCLTGRCLILGARIKATKHVSRLYMCDTHNIADFAFQILRSALELKPNTCEDIDYDTNNTVDLFRQYGMGPSLAELAQINRNELDRPGVLADSVEKFEMCTCNTMLCNSPEALRRMTVLKHEEHKGDRSSATRIISSFLVQIMALPATLLAISSVLRQQQLV